MSGVEKGERGGERAGGQESACVCVRERERYEGCERWRGRMVAVQLDRLRHFVAYETSPKF